MKRLIYRNARGKFTSAKKARIVQAGDKIYRIPARARKFERERIVNRARKQLNKVSFSDKIAKQLPILSGAPEKVRWTSEQKILNVPGKKNTTFEVTKYYFELNPPAVIDLTNVKDQTNEIMSKFWKRAKEVFIPGKNYLLRIDTAYKDNSGFSRTTAVLKAGKDGLSDGRGYSIGRYLEIDDLDRLLKYFKDSIYGFLKSFETYIARKGIISGQINAITMEIS